MKLSVKQIQVLDYLLKRLNTKYSYSTGPQTLNLVLRINNHLWKGDFVSMKNSLIIDTYIDSYSCIETSYNKSITSIEAIKSFNSRKYSQISSSTLNLLLEDLVKLISDIDCSNVDLMPFLYNATNLDTKSNLPFLYLDSEITYDVVSIDISVKCV